MSYSISAELLSQKLNRALDLDCLFKVLHNASDQVGNSADNPYCSPRKPFAPTALGRESYILAARFSFAHARVTNLTDPVLHSNGLNNR